jgi:RND family efflux transporter MFP subunit
LNNLSLAEEKMNNAEAALKIAEGDLLAAQGTLKKAKDELLLVKADPRDIDIAVFESQVEAADRTIKLLEKDLSDMTLRAPADGTITDVSIEQGERIAQNQKVVVMISKKRFELEVFVPEEDIVAVDEGMDIEFTLDAFPKNTRFRGAVRLIEPSATVIEEEVYYKIKGIISADIPELRDGMTADVDIIAGKKENALLISTRVIQDIDGRPTVLVIDNNGRKEMREIQTGISDDNFTEVVSGLSEGEKIAVK